MSTSIGSQASQALKHGHQIYVYSNIRTNQVVYSLTRSMKNNTSLKQLPWLGKKSIPAALRKDLWTPLCLVTFPSASTGLTTYRKLREYRRLHETAYPLEVVTQTEGPHSGQLLPKKKKGKVLMNQKANTVADMAAVLLMHDEEWNTKIRGEKREQAVEQRARERVARMKEIQAEVDALSERLKDTALPTAEVDSLQIERRRLLGNFRNLRSEDRKAKNGIPPRTNYDEPALEAAAEAASGAVTLDGTVIRWTNILDAEFAETWPKAVVHDGLQKSRYTAAFPAAEVVEEELFDEELDRYEGQATDEQLQEGEGGNKGWKKIIPKIPDWLGGKKKGKASVRDSEGV